MVGQQLKTNHMEPNQIKLALESHLGSHFK